MTRQGFMSLAAGVSVVTGLATLLAPAQIASVFGVALNDAGIAQTRLLGAAYLGYAVIVWFGKDVQDHAARRAIALGNVVSYALSAVVTVVARGPRTRRNAVMVTRGSGSCLHGGMGVPRLHRSGRRRPW